MIRWSHPERDVALPAPLRESAVTREAIEAGVSTALLERLQLSDGRRLVCKHVSPALDWMMAATHDSGRAATLWVDSWMERCPPTIDAALVRIEDGGGDGWLLYMDELTFHRAGTRLGRIEVERILGALADLHAAFAGMRVPPLCSLDDLLTLVQPQKADRYDPAFAGVLRAGWERFGELVPGHVAEAVLALLDDPHPLVELLASQPTTLTHSDPHLGNAVLLEDRLALIDWGLAAQAPATVDLVWFLDQSHLLLDVPHDEVVDWFLQAEDGRATAAMVDAACLAQLVCSGWQAAHWPDDEHRPARQANLDWFVDRARRVLS